MAPSREAWAQAFHRQASSDWQVFRLLQESADIPQCHALHYLQMVCEKLSKAYRLRDTDSTVETLTARHVGFPRFFAAWLLSPTMERMYQGRGASRREIRKRVMAIAREVERLAPAVDRETTPANTEYPWADDTRVWVPCEYAFSSLALLTESSGRQFLRFIQAALDDFRGS